MRSLTHDISHTGLAFIPNHPSAGLFLALRDISVTLLLRVNPILPEHGEHSAACMLSWVSVSQGHVGRLEALSWMLIDPGPEHSLCQSRVELLFSESMGMLISIVAQRVAWRRNINGN